MWFLPHLDSVWAIPLTGHPSVPFPPVSSSAQFYLTKEFSLILPPLLKLPFEVISHYDMLR